MAERARTVVVIGAGMSGLVAIKSCLEEDLDVVCFEKTDSIGGLWKYRENGLSCMKTTVYNSSKEFSAFSDFPFPPQTPNFPIWHQYLQYLESYADHFHLTSHIRLQHEVVRIEEGPKFKTKGDWKVTINDINNGKQYEIIAEKLMLCTGLFNTPKYATFLGLDTFTGQVIHSCHLKSPQDFEDKKVLVVGTGSSGYDAAAELANVATKVYCIVKPGVVVISRMGLNGIPYDLLAVSRFKFLKWALYRAPDEIAKNVVKKCAVKYDRDLYGLPMVSCMVDPHFIFVNDHLPFYILNGKILMKNQIERFTANAVVFEGDSTEHEVDVVIMATGYEIPHYSFFKNGELDAKEIRYELYKKVFPIKHQHSTMAIIGSTRFLGSMAALVEMQCRWAVMVFKNKVHLPPKAVMEKEIEPSNGSEMKLAWLMMLPYLDDVAKMIGAKPNFLKIFFTDPRLFRAWFFGPFVPYQYRLTGPHSWDKARETILTVPDRVMAGITGNRDSIKNTHSNWSGRNQYWRISASLIVISTVFVCCFYRNK